MYTAPFQWNGINITGRGFDPYGIDIIPRMTKDLRADIVLTLLDAWIFEPPVVKDLRWVSWFPIDTEPVAPAVLKAVRYAFDRIVYSKFAVAQMEENDVPCHYVPHGTDTQMFTPLPDKRAEFRQAIGLPIDAYIVGMVAANKGYPSRKAFEQNLAAFKMLADKHKDAILFLQTWSGEGGNDCVNIVKYCNAIGLQLGKNVFFCDQFVNSTTGFPDNYMNALYNSLDVLLSVSRGEGFGIPILEAQSAGTPVIVGDWTSMSELCFAGWKVDKSEATREYTKQNLGSFWYTPHVGAIADRLEASYNRPTNIQYSDHARRGALNYDVRKIAAEYWKPTLEQIAAKIERVDALRKLVVTPVAAPTDTQALDVKEVTA